MGARWATHAAACSARRVLRIGAQLGRKGRSVSASAVTKRLAACAGIALLGPLVASSAAAAELACPPRAFRWQEDCSSIARSAADLGWLRLRGIPLSDDRSSWLTLGGEYRFRVE